MRTHVWTCLLSLLLLGPTLGQDKPDDLAAMLQKLDGNVLATDKEKAAEVRKLVGGDIRKRLQESNDRETDAWAKIKTKADWEKYRDTRIEALRKSLGVEFKSTDKPVVHVTKTITGDGYRIENLVYESRPGYWVTGNLYLPPKAPASMPGILLIHSHHSPKWQGELQEMGILWARLGCAVLVIDQLGHGERRQHPFVDEKSFPKPYARSRQDYHFRYNVELQLSLIGESLMGVMVADMRRGVDVMLAHAKVDKDRIILMGSVAGGGDPAAVTAALEPRIAAVVPFNFGGPQPETRFPLPDNPEKAFNYVGGGGWESTRNLKLSAQGGFHPWLIVGSVAPRGLIYAHEFAWDKDKDPVWARYQKIWGFYDAKDKLAFTHGFGTLTSKDPVGSHCNNIGREHRKAIYPALEKWFKIPVPEKAPDTRHTVEELTCWTPELQKKLEPGSVTTLAGKRADALKIARNAEWEDLLLSGSLPKGGNIREVESKALADVKVVRLVIEDAIPIPVLLLLPNKPKEKVPVVIAIAQHGKQQFLKDRAAEIAGLLQAGIAVCLPDLRGTGETAADSGRERRSSATGHSSSELMLGQTMMGHRAVELGLVRNAIAGKYPVDNGRVAIWGESFMGVNASDSIIGVPLELEQPRHAEPNGALLALLFPRGGENVRAILARGGLVSYRSVLESPFVHVPHDAIVPSASRAGDVPQLVATSKAKQIRLEGLVDGLNRRVSLDDAKKTLKPGKNVELNENYSDAKTIVAWFAEQLK